MISVVIPTYNRERTIGRAIDSVLQQTYQDIEIIVVDDCSSDHTEQVAIGYHDDRIRFIRHDTNQGACAARNTGIDHAQGEYIAFQDSDDAWRPDKLERQLAAMNECDADICFCRVERHNYPEDKERYFPDLDNGIVEYQTLILRSLASTQTIIARREVWLQHRFDVAIKRMQDYDWMIRAARDYKVCYVSDVLVDIYLQDDSITTSSYQKLCEINQALIDKYRDLCAVYPGFYVGRLDRIAYYKTRMGLDGSEEYREIYRVSGTKRSLLKYILSKAGLLRLYYAGSKD